MQSGGARCLGVGIGCDGFCEGKMQLTSSMIFLLVHTFVMALLWMGCQSCGCACREGNFLKEALTGIE